MERPSSRVSFSAEVKGELLQIEPEEPGQLVAELAAFVRIAGSLSLNSGIRFEVDKAAVAKRVFADVKRRYGHSSQISSKEYRRLGKSHQFIVLIQDQSSCRQLLLDIGYLDEHHNFVGNRENRFLRPEKTKRSYLRTVFLLCGSVTNPEKNYHLELVLQEEDLAKELQKALRKNGLNAKRIPRKGSCVVYLKDAENIVDFLTYIGASKSVLDFYNVKIVKEMRNQINRTVNCETANIQKTVNAAARQLESIQAIQSTKGLSFLPDELRQVAELRLACPDATLVELLEELPEKITKSGLHHRLAKLDQIAQELGEE